MLDSRAFQQPSLQSRDTFNVFGGEFYPARSRWNIAALHLFVVVVMVAVVNRTLLRPINKVLEERDKNILGRVAEAKDLLSDREQAMTEYNQGLREARTEGYHLLEKERAQAVMERDDEGQGL